MNENEQASTGKANTLLGLQFLSDFGDQITTALLALCVLDITKSTSKVGLVYFISTFGFVVFTFVGGYLGDRLSKRNILVYSDIGRGLIVLLMIIAFKERSIVLIYITSFLLSILGSLHRPVKLSIWAQSIPHNRLESYNCCSEFSTQASTIVGPLIASFFIAQELVSFSFAIDSLTFFLCAIFFAIIIQERSKPQTGNKRDLLHGFRLIARDHEMLKYVSYDAIQMIGFGAFNATFLVLAQRDFGWTKVEYSYHLSIMAIFALAGASLGATKAIVNISANTKLVTCAILSSLALFMVMQIESFPMASILFGVCDGLAVITMVVARTKVQLIAKAMHPDFISSILASRSIIIKGATLLGTGTCIIIDDYLNLELTLCLYIIPIGLSFLPFVIKRREPVSVLNMAQHQKVVE